MRTEPVQKSVRRFRWGRIALTIFAALGFLVAWFAVVSYLRDTERQIVELDLRNLQESVRMYHHKFGRFPTTDEGFQALVRENILQRQPRDPWGGEYRYKLDDGVPVVTTLGADRTMGGSGRDEDLSASGSGNEHGSGSPTKEWR